MMPAKTTRRRDGPPCVECGLPEKEHHDFDPNSEEECYCCGDWIPSDAVEDDPDRGGTCEHCTQQFHADDCLPQHLPNCVVLIAKERALLETWRKSASQWRT